MRRASAIAGVALLVMAVLGIFANFIGPGGIATEGDPARIVTDISNAEGTFRAGIVSFVVVAVLDVVVAWALYTVFEPVSRSLSLLAAWFRVVYAGVLVVAVSHLIGVLAILETPELAGSSQAQLHAQALLELNTFNEIWSAGFVSFGVHLLVLGYLAYRAGYVPTYLGVLLAIAGLGYLVDSIGPLVYSGYSIELALFTFVGEIVLIVWLLIRERHVELNEAVATTAD